MLPGLTSPTNSVPSNITLPNYCTGKDGEEQNDIITIKNKKEIESMRLSCALAKKMLNAAKNFARVCSLYLSSTTEFCRSMQIDFIEFL